MARPRVHDQATGEALLDAAAGLLRDGGPAAVSVRAVADACDLSVRAVYAVFGSKRALVDGLAERGYHSLTRRVHAAPETSDPGRDLVEAGASAFRGFATEEPEMFRLTFEQVSAEVLQRVAVSRAAHGSYQVLQRAVGRVRAAGSIHPDRSDEVCILEFHSLCQGLAAVELASVPPPGGPGFWPTVRGRDLGAVWRDALSSLVDGFAAAPAVVQ